MIQHVSIAGGIIYGGVEGDYLTGQGKRQLESDEVCLTPVSSAEESVRLWGF